jgi:hypothetical protein
LMESCSEWSWFSTLSNNVPNVKPRTETQKQQK